MTILSLARNTAAIGLVLTALPAAAATSPAISEVPTIAGSRPYSITASSAAEFAYFTDISNVKVGIATYSSGLGVTEKGSALGPPGSAAIGVAISATTIAPAEFPSVWVTVPGTTSAIVVINPSTGSAIQSFPLSNANEVPELITLGPDGNLWFAVEPESCGGCLPAPVSSITRITPEGVATPVTTGLVAGSAPYGIAAGPDGALWFTDPNSVTPAIGRVTTAATPVLTEFTNAQSPGLSATSLPVAIAADADGHLWFTDTNSVVPALGRITPAAVAGNPPTIVEFPLPRINSVPAGIALGTDGNIWFTDQGCPTCGTPVPPAIGRITPDGASMIEFPLSEFSGGAITLSAPQGITGSAGGPGALFFADEVGAIGQVTIPTDTLKVTVNGIAGSTLATADVVTSAQGPGVTGVLAQAHIQCDQGGSTCAADFPDATTVTLTAAPAMGEMFTGWGGAGAAAGGCTTALVCAVPLSGNVDSQITATFTAAPPPTVVLSVTPAGATMGTVTSSPAGIACGSTCSASYTIGTPVTLTAVPAQGYSFAGWSGGACSGIQPCTVTMEMATTVNANYAANSKSDITLFSAILPSSRSVKVGNTATVFATLINSSSDTTANICTVQPATSLPASFSFQPTDAKTNALTGSPNVPVNIAPGAAQSFVLSLTPNAPMPATQVPFTFTCANAPAAASNIGLNTLLFSAAAAQPADIVALAATASNDGIVDIPGATGAGAFAVATVNLGISAAITASANVGNANLPVAISICETVPATGQCMAPPAASVATSIASDATPTFAVFVQGKGNVPFLPAINRVFVQFQNDIGSIQGSTSVAVRTQ